MNTEPLIIVNAVAAALVVLVNAIFPDLGADAEAVILGLAAIVATYVARRKVTPA